MNILFIHEVDLLKKVVYDVHILAEAMSLRDHNVYALDYSSREQKSLKMNRVFSSSQLCLMRQSLSLSIPVIGRMFAFASYYPTIKRIIEEKQIDAIVLYSVPTNGLQAISLASRYKIPIVFRSLDAVHQLVTHNSLKLITKIFERVVYTMVDRVLTLTPLLSDYVFSLGADRENVFVLPMTVDTKRFSPREERNGLRGKWGLASDDQIILFMGTLFDFSGLDDLIPYFQRVIRKFPKAKLLIVGDGQQSVLLERIIDYLHLNKNIIITGFQPYEDMPDYINMADICINPFRENGATRDIFPGKTVQFLACGKPLLNTKLSGMMSMIQGEGQGVLYTSDGSEMADMIIQLLEKPELRHQLGQNGIAYVNDNHRCEAVAEELERHLEVLCGG